MKFLTVICLFIASTLSTFGQTKMSPTEVSQFKKSVETEAKKAQSILADFEEDKHVKVLKNSSQATGVFKYKNNQLLWQYNAPKKSALLFSGNKLSMKNDKGRSTTIDLNKNKRFKQLQQLMVGSYTGNIFDETNFTINYYKDSNKKWAVLTPKTKDMSKYIKEVTFWFKNGENRVSEIKIKESNDDYSLIKLKNVKVNATINDSELKL